MMTLTIESNTVANSSGHFLDLYSYTCRERTFMRNIDIFAIEHPTLITAKMRPFSIFALLLGVISLVQAQVSGLEIKSPKEGDRIDIQQGLPISWIVDDTDNLFANVTIYLFLGYNFYLELTRGESVPIIDAGYMFQYTPDKGFIAADTNYIIRLRNGPDSDHVTGKFEIFNTSSFVTSVPVSAPKPTATRKAPSKSPSASASASVTVVSTPIPIRHHTPTASSAAAGLTMDGIPTGAMGLVLLEFLLFMA
ncbi:hypothetical protein TSTA_051000 [Talaromyces stipitatus ATCC 10500]|uniref:Uncharacterized protein n=1 Tax=Talaromyces stipitatus (strain ATCC 10500 / CBS 375.48 / QM 6759 / NRRL 1006) TaxID=441959 RepID=B8MJ00_TALSN|nr:uncharacterized protein TSTA_051000 [Talaromyces stipitatus ATCC 10500]EED15662.1 hypothetical protein TSTA_051000 [Talaromyces stipitatus ATCC 10500]